MLFVGILYASLAMLLVHFVFARDAVLSKYSGLLLVTFTVMFSMPFIYYTIKLEEKKISPRSTTWELLKEHEHAILAFLWLFLGFVIAFSFWYVALSSTQNFQAQIETFCVINRPSSIDSCIKSYGISDSLVSTTSATSADRLFLIFTNNVYVLIFTLIFSLIFGAGVIFILAWNASVISAAIGIFSKSSYNGLPNGLARYMLHGLPEIASYFIVALAGGMISIAVIRHELGTPKFWEVLQDSLNLIVISLVVLFLAALLEVFITPMFF